MTTKEIELKGVKLLTKLMVEDNIQGTDNSAKIEATTDAFEALGVTLVPSINTIKHEWSCITVLGSDYSTEYPLTPSKRDVISIILGRDIDRNECEAIKRDWKAFYNDPVRYRMSLVIGCICEYLDDLIELSIEED